MNQPTTITRQQAKDARQKGASRLDDARRAILDAAKAYDRAGESGVHHGVMTALVAVDDAMSAAAKREQSEVALEEDRRMDLLAGGQAAERDLELL